MSFFLFVGRVIFPLNILALGDEPFLAPASVKMCENESQTSGAKQ